MSKLHFARVLQVQLLPTHNGHLLQDEVSHPVWSLHRLQGDRGLAESVGHDATPTAVASSTSTPSRG